MAQGIFLHDYNTGGKLYDGDVGTAANQLANKAYVTANALLKSDNLSSVANKGTARTNLGVAIGSDVQAYSIRLGELAALSQSDGSIVVSDGTSFVFESGATARTSLGVDAAGTDNSTNVTLAGKDYASISGQAITFGQVDLTDDVTGTLPIANGGIGATSAPMVGVITAADAAAVRALIDLEPGTDVQAYDAELAALAGLTSAANKIPMFSGSGTASLVSFLDEDDLSSDSSSAVPSQQSVKAYVDGVRSGLDIKDSVRVATTAAGTLASSFANGQTVDGVTLATGDRILVKDQSDASENGIFTVNASGAPTRATDCDATGEVTAGLFVFVAEGTSNSDAGFVLTTNDGTGDLDPNTSSRYTGFDPTFGSATSVSGVTLSSATLNSSTGYISYSAGNTGVTFPNQGVIILSDGSDTIAYRLGSNSAMSSGSGSIQLMSGNPYNDAQGESSVSSMSASSVTSISYKSLSAEGLQRTINSSSITHTSTSLLFQGGGNWGGGSVPSGKFIEFKASGSTPYYYRTTSALSNGDSFISVVADTDSSDSATWTVYPGASTPMNFFDSQGSAALTPGTSDLAFTQFSGAGQITAGDGLQKSGNSISADLKANGGLVIESGEIAIDLGASSITGALANGDLANSAVTLSQGAGMAAMGSVSLGGSVTVAVDGVLEDLDTLGAAASDGQFIVATGSGAFAYESGATVRTSLGLGSAAVEASSAFQAADAELSALAGLTSAADKGIQFTGSGSAGTFDLTAAGKALLDDANAAAQRTTLGLGSASGEGVTILEEDLASSDPSSIANVGAMKGLYIFDLSGANSPKALSLPTTAGQTVGAKVTFKIKDTVGSGSSLVISGQSNQKIDATASITLDQQYQSVTLVLSTAFTGSSAIQCWVAI